METTAETAAETADFVTTGTSSAPSAPSSAPSVIPVGQPTIVHISLVPFASLLADPNFLPLTRAYAAECLVPDAEPQPAMYEAMEQAGMLTCFAAYVGDGQTDRLAGFCSVITAIVPHDGHLVATTESIFVHPTHRATPAFSLLFAAAEDYATSAGCRVLTCGARRGSALDRVLSRRAGFSPTHTQHTKWLGEWKPGPGQPAEEEGV